MQMVSISVEIINPENIKRVATIALGITKDTFGRSANRRLITDASDSTFDPNE